MNPITFNKLQASGNDFILLDTRHPAPGTRLRKENFSEFAKSYCDRKFGIGADGVLVIEKSKKADFKMRIFNADGSEAEMCGNGARCAALYYANGKGQVKIKFETLAGIIEAYVIKENVKIKMTDPVDLKLDFPIEVCSRRIRANFINTGVPHTVIFVENLGSIDVNNIGKSIRYHKFFSPKGTNVNFVEVGDSSIGLRTYERGVEAETLACGTGTVASAIISAVSNRFKKIAGDNPVKVKTKSGYVLKVYFKIKGKTINDVWLDGKTHFVYSGQLN